jgi:ribosomal protein S18 acetylase RimI-like enzyme
MSPAYRLRPCTAADHDWAYALKCDAYREVVERQFGPWDEAFQRELFDQRCWKPALSHVVLIDGQAAGLVAWEDRGDHLWLDEIQIVRDQRGRGLGSSLLRDLLAEARATAKPLRLQVLRENRRAQALYRHLGFNLTGETTTHIQMEHGR